MLEKHCTWNFSYFDHRQGEGRQWAAHLLWLQSSFLPVTDWTPLNVHRPFFLLQTIGHFSSVRYHTLIWGFQVRLWGEGKENIWFGGVSTKPHLLHTCLKPDSPTIFSGLCTQSRASILLPTLLGSHYTCFWCHWYDSKTNVAQNATGPSHGSLV